MESLSTLLPLILVGTVIWLLVRSSKRRQRGPAELTAPFQTSQGGPGGAVAASEPVPMGTFKAAVSDLPASDSVPEGWYPDPEGKPCARYWDGDSWTDKTRPVTGPIPQTPVDAASRAAVPAGGQFGYRASDNTFHGSLAQLMPLAVRAVQSFGWTVTGASETASMLSFETKVSWGSWSGITCSLTFHEMAPGIWRVTGTGKQNLRGRQAFTMDMGESSGKVTKAVEKMKTLAPRVG